MVNKRTMNGDGLKEAIETLGYSMRGAAHFLGVSERQIFRWLKQDHIPRAYAMVLRVMLSKSIDAKEMLEITGVRDEQREFILAHLHDQRPWMQPAEGDDD